MEEKTPKISIQKIKQTGRMSAPSLITVANMACGFFSILASVNGQFNKAGWLILIALLFDMFDGRIARMLKAESSFGVEIDSLADLISFCLAPAMLMYFFALRDGVPYGSLVAFIYALFGALRLAKFNSMAYAGKDVKKQFSGLPTPAGAAILASFVVSFTLTEDATLRGSNIPFLVESILPYVKSFIVFIMIGLSLLMVSNVPYAAFKAKQQRYGRRNPFIFLFFAALIFLLIKYPQNVVFIVFSVYVLFGLFMVLFRAFKNLK